MPDVYVCTTHLISFSPSIFGCCARFKCDREENRVIMCVLCVERLWKYFLMSYVNTKHEMYGCIDVYNTYIMYSISKRKYNNSSLFEDPRNSIVTEVELLLRCGRREKVWDNITRYII